MTSSAGSNIVAMSSHSNENRCNVNKEDFISRKFPNAKAEIVVNVVSAGRRPIRLIDIYGKRKPPLWWKASEIFLIKPQKQLEETEQAVFRFEFSPICFGLRNMFIRDSTGKSWKVNKQSFRKTLMEADALGIKDDGT